MSSIGDQMKGALNEALKTGDFAKLNALVADTVSSALSDAGVTTSKAWQQQQQQKAEQQARKAQQEAEWRKQVQKTRNTASWEQQKFQEDQIRSNLEEIRRQQELQRQQQQQNREKQRELQLMRKEGLTVPVKNVGFVPGVLFVVFGAVANVPLFVLSILGMVFGWGATGALLFSLFVSIFFINNGKNKIQLINKAKRYVRMCGSKMFAEVEDLAAQIGVSPKRVEREIRKILQKGIIPTAHIDKKGTHLMLTDTLYKQFSDAEKAHLLREKQEKLEKKEKKSRLTGKNKEDLPVVDEVLEPKTQLEKMVEEGQECIRKIRYMNDLIPGETISAKMDRLESLLKEIFAQLEKDPTQMNRMHKVMSYYLPTTLKLVEAYHEFDSVSNPGEEIISAKQEIEDTLDTINAAFVELLNSLFQAKVMDVTTDAQVLQTVLSSDGLTKGMDITKPLEEDDRSGDK